MNELRPPRAIVSERLEPLTLASVRDAVSIRRAIEGGIVVAWLIGMGVLLVRLVRGLIVLAALRRSARPVDAEALRTVRDEVRAGLRTARLPAILESPRVAGPVATGVLRPAVILPEGLVGSIPHAALRDILIHECAHIARRDPLIGLLQRLAELVYWPHPLVHVLNRRLSRAREEACDDVVLSRADPIDYARTLLTLAQRFETARRTHGAPALLSSGWKLEDRVAGILNPRRKLMKLAHSWIAIVAAVMLVAVGVAVAGVRWEQSGPSGPSGPEVAAADGSSSAPHRTAQGRRIEGVVIDDAWDEPIAGAIVRLLRDERVPGSVTTGPDGSFAIETSGPLLPKVDVIATSADGRLHGMGTFEEPLDSQSVSNRVRIKLKPGWSIEVAVTDGKRAPVAGAAVEVISTNGSLAMGRTDAAGRALLHYPEDTVVERVIALKPGMGFDYFENYRTWPGIGRPRLPERVALSLNGARTSRIRTIDTQGRPVAGVDLSITRFHKHGKLSETLLAGSRATRVRTDAEGVAVLDWLPVDVGDEVILDVPSVAFYATTQPIVLKPHREPLESKIPLARNARLRGQVVHEDGRPAANILVRVSSVWETSQDPFQADTRTRPDGTYEIAVPPNHSYRVAVIDQTWAALSQTDVGMTVEGQPRDVAELRLIKGTVIRGHVTIGPRNWPAANQRVSLQELGKPLRKVIPNPVDLGVRDREFLDRETRTDASGRYLFRVGPGLYRLQSPGGVTNIMRVPSDKVITIDFPLGDVAQRRDFTLRGRVLDGRYLDAVAVADALVRVPGVETGPHEQVLTDAEGRFALRRRVLSSSAALPVRPEPRWLACGVCGARTTRRARGLPPRCRPRFRPRRRSAWSAPGRTSRRTPSTPIHLSVHQDGSLRPDLDRCRGTLPFPGPGRQRPVRGLGPAARRSFLGQPLGLPEVSGPGSETDRGAGSGHPRALTGAIYGTIV